MIFLQHQYLWEKIFVTSHKIYLTTLKRYLSSETSFFQQTFSVKSRQAGGNAIPFLFLMLVKGGWWQNWKYGARRVESGFWGQAPTKYMCKGRQDFFGGQKPISVKGRATLSYRPAKWHSQCRTLLGSKADNIWTFLPLHTCVSSSHLCRFWLTKLFFWEGRGGFAYIVRLYSVGKGGDCLFICSAPVLLDTICVKFLLCLQ